MGLSNLFSALREKAASIVWPRQRFPRVEVRIESDTAPDPRDPDAPAEFFCYAGEDVVCDGPGRHVIATAAEDIRRGAMSERCNEQFYWFQPPPAIGALMKDIKCQKCDGRWVAGCMNMHFKGGWR